MLREGMKLSTLRKEVERGLVRLDTHAPDIPRRLPPYYWAAFILSGDWR
jgi:CHAT domain-containing protein